MHHRTAVFTYQENVFNEEASYAATPSIMDVFDLEVVKGDPKSGLETSFYPSFLQKK